MIAASRNERERTQCFDRTPTEGNRAANRPGNLSEADCRRKRIREVFGIAEQAPLPQVRRDTLDQYHRYLAARLTFPFQAAYFDEYEGDSCDNVVTATRLIEPNGPRNPRFAIECEVLAGNHRVHVPLSALRLAERSPRQQAIDDYRHWLDAQR